jgi:hypothetical protein
MGRMSTPVKGSWAEAAVEPGALVVLVAVVAAVKGRAWGAAVVGVVLAATTTGGFTAVVDVVVVDVVVDVEVEVVDGATEVVGVVEQLSIFRRIP